MSERICQIVNCHKPAIGSIEDNGRRIFVCHEHLLERFNESRVKGFREITEEE